MDFLVALWHLATSLGQLGWVLLTLWVLLRYARGWQLRWVPPARTARPANPSDGSR